MARPWTALDDCSKDTLANWSAGDKKLICLTYRGWWAICVL
jgi:hypothetical protein